MKKHQFLIPVISFFILAFSFLLLKLEKKEVIIAGYKTFFKDTIQDANTILQTYGTALYQINAAPLPVKPNTVHSLFLESKVYSAAANNHPVLYYRCDSSLSVTIYNKYGYPNTEDNSFSNGQNNKLSSVLLKYQ